MRRILTLLLLAGCLSPAIADPIRAMSWNIRYFNLRDGIDAWPNRKDWAADLINRTKPDIIGLQEVVQRQMTDLKKGLKDYDAYGVGRDDGKRKANTLPSSTVGTGFRCLRSQPSGCQRRPTRSAVVTGMRRLPASQAGYA